MQRFCSLAGGTAVDIFMAVFGEGRPPKVALYELDSFVATRVTCKNGVVIFAKDLLSYVGNVRDNDSVIPANETVFEGPTGGRAVFVEGGLIKFFMFLNGFKKRAGLVLESGGSA